MPISLKTKISTPLFDETVAFYKRVFYFTFVEEWDHPDDKGAILALSNNRDEALLEIYASDVKHDFSGLSLQFRVENIDRFMKTLPKSCNYEGPRPRPWGSTYLYIRDPNGILLVVYEGGM